MKNLTPFQTRCSRRKIRTLLFLGLFLSAGFSPYLQAKDDDGDAGGDPVLPDYTITTTGNAIVITDVSGNGETLTVSESGGNIRFNVTGRTYQINAGAVTPFTTPADVALAGATSITVNTANGNDIINIGAFTANLPSLTINGGTGDDAVNLNGDINFAANANLDVDLQNDDATPGADALTIATNANVKLFGTGTATVKVSKNVRVNAGGSLETVDGNLLVEANQQPTPTTGNFVGVIVTGAGSLLQSTGSGSVTVKSKGGDAAGGFQYGVNVALGGQINGHTVTVVGNGGVSSGSNSYGVVVVSTNSRITSSGGNVSVTGTGGGTGTSGGNHGVYVLDAGQITAGGTGSVTVTGNGGASTGDGNYGVYVFQTNSRITSSGGNVSVTGTGGGTSTSAQNYGVWVFDAGQITAGGAGTVTVTGNGGASSGVSNVGVLVRDANALITSSGGNVSVTGQEGNGSSGVGIVTSNSGSIRTATNGGNLNLIANSMDIVSVTPVSTNAAATLTLRPFTAGTPINLGSAANPIGGPLSLSDAELNLMTTGTLIIGHAAAGAITVSAGISRPAATNVQLRSAGDVSLSGGGINTGGGTLLLDPGTSPAAVKPTFNGTDVTASTLSFGSDLALAINGTTPGTQYDQLIVVGSINLTGVSLVLSGMPTLTGGETFTLVDNDGSDAITGTFTGLAQGATLSNFLGSGLNATISYTGGTGNDVVISVNTPLPDYTITTTGNAIVITDVSGNGETLTVSESGGNIRFNVTGRTYQINAGTVTPFTTPADVALAGATSITVNTANGNDIINIGAFTANLPSLTINGGTGDDAVNFNGDINFAANANLNADLQDDDATPGADALTIAANANVKLFGTGTATVKVSKNVTVNAGSSLETTDGNLLVEANQQPTPTTGSFDGVLITGAGSLLQSTGSGSVTVKGKGGDAAVAGSSQDGVALSNRGQINGTTVTVVGNGGASPGNNNYGVVVSDPNSLITSSGGNVSVTGTGGGTGASRGNIGVMVLSAGQITAGGTGAVTVTGNGGASSGTGNCGVGVSSINSLITSSGGNVSVTGKEGNGPSGLGIITSASGSVSTATNGGNLSLIANSMDIRTGTSLSTNAASTLSLRPFTNGTAINLGSATDPIGGPLSLSDAELDLMTTGTLIIGDAAAGTITVSADISRPAATNVQLRSAGDVSLSGGGINTGGGTLLLDPGTSPASVKPTFNGTDVTASTLSFGSDLALAINGTAPGTQYDQLIVVGSINLTGVSLVLSGTPILTGGETFTLVDNDGNDAITGTFTGLAQGATLSNFLGSGRNATISYTGGTGNDVVITVSSLPTAVVSGGGTVCSSAPLPNVSIALTGTPPWAITYSNGTTSTTVPVVNVSPYVITEAAPGTYTVTAVSNADGFGTSMTGSAIVTVLAPSIPANPQGDTIYVGQSANLTAEGCTGTGFALLWFNAADNSLVSLPVSPLTTTSYYAKCQQTLGAVTCLSTQSAPVNVVVLVSQRIFVNIANTNPSQDGTSWDKAFANLQDGLAAARSATGFSVEIWVAQGTYKPGNLRQSVFDVPSGVSIYGGFIGTEDQLTARDWKIHKTILSGEIGTSQLSDNVYHVVYLNATNAETRLDGFQIERGYAEFFVQTQEVVPPAPQLNSTGGGILAVNKSKGLITNCIITDNRAGGGGGAMIQDSSLVRITKTIIWGNEANFGGGLYIQSGSKPLLQNVLIVTNKGLGGGLYVNYSEPLLIHCTIADNQGVNGTGGVFNTNSVSTLKNSILWGNTTPQTTPGSLITYSIVEGGIAGTANLNLNPRFVNAGSSGLAPLGSLGDYHLLACSPAINTADTDATITDDLDGSPRPSTSGLAFADMGAFENQSKAGGSGPAKLNITESITEGTVLKTGGQITATNQVSGATVIYQGAQSVTLLPGFSATGNTFLAIIGECAPTSTPSNVELQK